MTQTGEIVGKMSRIRKAWRVTVKGFDGDSVVFAPNAGKARMGTWYAIDRGGVRIVDIVVRRAQEDDVALPNRSPVANDLSQEEAHCLLHAFGGNGDPLRAGNRDYFYTHRSDPLLVSLVERGLMRPSGGDTKSGDDMIYFFLTQHGKDVAFSMVPEYGP